jgi:hypothetical protein
MEAEVRDPEKVVLYLNSELIDNNEDFCVNFGMGLTYKTDGYSRIIEFMEFTLWSDEDDERDYNEETDEFEQLEPFLKRKFNELIDNLTSLKLKEGTN